MVSVIVPVYNTEKYLAEAINSVQEQTCREWELLLINDGSTDGSLEICRKFEREGGGGDVASLVHDILVVL